MGISLLNEEKIVTVSEFSQGRSGKIFNDVNNNKCDYVVMKNNSPVAVIIPVEEYRSMKERIAELEKIFRHFRSSADTADRIGVAEGRFEVPDDFDDWDVGFGDDDYGEDLT
ncbi:MAG: type II toxin-antitoxin system Phd/YefM family antitoxin [Clostridiales bacterium]|nr:type II toxin-antitoxin system Phd/YefM family antitoxin [Clostridiales bacterium]